MTTDPAGPDQRTRILAAALDLMGERGVAGTSMRRLASACGLNVATLYHYFPSKADLVRALLTERGYTERLRHDRPAVDPAATPSERLVALVRYLFDEALEEASVWRVLVAEGIHGDPDVRLAITSLVGELDVALGAWVGEVLPEVAARGLDPAQVGNLVQTVLFAEVVQELAVGGADPERPAQALAEAVFGPDEGGS